MMTPEDYKSQHATLCENVAAKGAEIERLRAALTKIAGMTPKQKNYSHCVWETARAALIIDKGGRDGGR